MSEDTRRISRRWITHSAHLVLLAPLVLWLTHRSEKLIFGAALWAGVTLLAQLVWMRSHQRRQLPSPPAMLNLNFAMLFAIMLTVDGAWPVMVFAGLFAVGVLWMLEYRWTALLHAGLILGVALNAETLVEPTVIGMATLAAMANTAWLVAAISSWEQQYLSDSLQAAGASRWVLDSDGGLKSALGLVRGVQGQTLAAHEVATWITQKPPLGSSIEFDAGQGESAQWMRAVVERIQGTDRHLLLSDVTSERRSNDLLRFEASHDVLTGLKNRFAFEREVGQRVLGGEACTLLLVDLDRFKDVNDAFGHRVGDDVLKLAGSRLAGLDRVVSAARLGGDEFGLLALTDDSSQARKVAEDAAAAIGNDPFIVGTLSLSVGVSLGTATTPAVTTHATTPPGDSWDPERLLQQADRALYEAKQSGVHWLPFDPLRDERARRRLRLTGRLPEAIANRELVVHHQPKIDLSDGRIVGSEALVRWDHPHEGILGPDEFLPFVYVSGLVEDLTWLVLEQALADLESAQIAQHRSMVAVNVDGRSLSDPDFAPTILRLVADSGIPPSMLWIEITEEALVEIQPQTCRTLDQLSSVGIQISVDDFGTGYSSLAYLGRLTVNEIKLDRALVSNLSASGRSLAIATAVISLAHDLGAVVTAEGVEDRETYDLLHSMGCDYAQGYLMARPLPGAAYRSLVKSHWLDRPVPSR